tara:strand:+ start:417 stop:569 length:153 start_codon:yes stop_codon:yes gene_type:complete
MLTAAEKTTIENSKLAHREFLAIRLRMRAKERFDVSIARAVTARINKETA